VRVVGPAACFIAKADRFSNALVKLSLPDFREW
jgi:hypothetical protein